MLQWPPKAVLNIDSKDVSERFPALKALTSRDPEHIREFDGIIELENSLKAFVSSDANRVKRYFSFLGSFSSTDDQLQTQRETTQANTYGQSAKDHETPDDYPAHVHKTFYKTVKKYSQCCCVVPGGQPDCLKWHEGRLRLKENFQSKDDHVVFDVVLSRYPPLVSTNAIEWQHLQFHIPKYILSKPSTCCLVTDARRPPKQETGLERCWVRS
jgi:hypothetical protein